MMYHVDEVKNAQMAMDCFEWVIEQSWEREELLEASNGKSQGWWWKSAFEYRQEIRFRAWTKAVATTHQNDVESILYYALSHCSTRVDSNPEALAWFQLAWTLLLSSNESPPLGFHYHYTLILQDHYNTENQVARRKVTTLPILVSALEQFGLFISSITWKELYRIQKFVVIILFISV
jgi:hypothetical protein